VSLGDQTLTRPHEVWYELSPLEQIEAQCLGAERVASTGTTETRIVMTKGPCLRGNGKQLWMAAVLVTASALPGVAFAASSITGTITFEGKAPALRPLSMDADPACAKKHTAPVPNEMLALGSGNTMGNIMVWVSKGLPAGKTYPAPKTPVTMDQKGCMYVPHVMGIMVGQPYKILNSDGVLHNIHTLPKVNSSFNKGMPASLKETTTVFDKPEAVFHTKCDVHPWMSAYVAVFNHPFFSVTSTDGKFSIAGLEPGTYEITAWHEKLGTKTASVTVAANDKKTQDFKFAVPAK
jgi:plastocyanin